NLTPNVSNQVYCNSVDPAHIPEFLSAGDVFVLPTLNEGCCNAVVEAMGCGSAIVSSDRSFNYDVLNKDNSILIDPENIQAIREAVIRLKEDDALRHKLSNQAYADAQNLSIKERTARILQFISG
ncbi:MAG: glycosyltransferase family 4 protein, partial [Oscillospiraceae bacterium]|nr:glycosyltransferase family 4 protein [Oscillospiraceae bacterium]